MNAEDLGNFKMLNWIFKPAGILMGSRVRDCMNPVNTLKGADIHPGQTVLEVGCGTGFFTIPAAKLIGVIPFPFLPLNQLLPEMHRVLKPEGTLAVWLFPPKVHFWVPKAILESGLFTYIIKQNGVLNYRRG